MHWVMDIVESIYFNVDNWLWDTQKSLERKRYKL